MSKLDSTWRTSSHSGTNGACVEVRQAGAVIQVRHSKALTDGEVLDFTHKEWAAFVAGVKDDEFEIATA